MRITLFLLFLSVHFILISARFERFSVVIKANNAPIAPDSDFTSAVNTRFNLTGSDAIPLDRPFVIGEIFQIDSLRNLGEIRGWFNPVDTGNVTLDLFSGQQFFENGYIIAMNHHLWTFDNDESELLFLARLQASRISIPENYDNMNPYEFHDSALGNLLGGLKKYKNTSGSERGVGVTTLFPDGTVSFNCLYNFELNHPDF